MLLSVCSVLFPCFWLSVPVQSIVCKDLSLIWPVMCQVGRTDSLIHPACLQSGKAGFWFCLSMCSITEKQLIMFDVACLEYVWCCRLRTITFWWCLTLKAISAFLSFVPEFDGSTHDLLCWTTELNFNLHCADSVNTLTKLIKYFKYSIIDITDNVAL